jgi:hypothetical protein
MRSIQDLMIEYILFAFTEEELMSKFQVTEEELPNLSDVDLLEIYDLTLLAPIDDEINYDT